MRRLFGDFGASSAGTLDYAMEEEVVYRQTRPLATACANPIRTGLSALSQQL